MVIADLCAFSAFTFAALVAALNSGIVSLCWRMIRFRAPAAALRERFLPLSKTFVTLALFVATDLSISNLLVAAKVLIFSGTVRPRAKNT